jgi:hypothetical protein
MSIFSYHPSEFMASMISIRGEETVLFQHAASQEFLVFAEKHLKEFQWPIRGLAMVLGAAKFVGIVFRWTYS